MKIATSNGKQLAQSASAIGAAIFGFGLGTKWGAVVQTFAIVLVVIGAVIHTYGMYVTQMQRNTERTSRIAWLLWLSAWICLIALVGIFIYLSVTKS